MEFMFTDLTIRIYTIPEKILDEDSNDEKGCFNILKFNVIVHEANASVYGRTIKNLQGILNFSGSFTYSISSFCSLHCLFHSLFYFRFCSSIIALTALLREGWEKSQGGMQVMTCLCPFYIN